MPSSSYPSCIMTAILQKEGLGLVSTPIIIEALRWLAIIVCNDRLEGACCSSCSTCYPAHKQGASVLHCLSLVACHAKKPPIKHYYQPSAPAPGPRLLCPPPLSAWHLWGLSLSFHRFWCITTGKRVMDGKAPIRMYLASAWPPLESPPS